MAYAVDDGVRIQADDNPQVAESKFRRIVQPGRRTATGDFWVYADYPTKCATVHDAECSHCRNGQGQTREKKRAKLTTADWFGPFSTREAAFTRAEQTKLAMIRGCGHCKP